jgi:aminoglycoside phosphotransferase (APT) family kinase protein
MYTMPADLPELQLHAALAAGWGLRATRLDYRAVGFGSHHWELVDHDGGRWFVTVDDLRGRSDHRLRAALATARALLDAGHAFVVAPVPASGGELLVPVGGSYAVAVYPFVAGESFDGDEYTSEQRRAVLDLLITLHRVPAAVFAGHALVDDFVIPLRDAVDGYRDQATGPYARPAADLLDAHSAGVSQALDRYDDLVRGVRADPPGLVLTHGEPHPGNTMRTDAGRRLIDWDTALVAPPERDLWSLDPGDGSVFAAYSTETGTAVRADLLDLYRLRWDLAEIADCLARFRGPHASTADDVESWSILEELIPRVAG